MAENKKVSVELELQNCPICNKQPEILHKGGMVIIYCGESSWTKATCHKLMVAKIDTVEAVEMWNNLAFSKDGLPHD